MTDVHALARLQGVKGNTGKAMINHYTYVMLCMYVCMYAEASTIFV